MKLRIRGNSIRLRLTQSDVARLATEGRVEEATEFRSGTLKYAIVATSDGHVKAEFEDNAITVSVPENSIAAWADSEQVGIDGMHSIPDGELQIQIEKDFACLKPRAGEDDADTFTNPLAAGNG